jgi:(R,R)-butanediol dehydrogenase / meso-butanediol dehydrogenase / diacetyl reductase
MGTMEALVWRGGQLVQTASVPRPDPPPGWALVEMAYVGLCGSDLHICAGEHPRAKPGLVLGHEFVGRAAEGPGPIAAGAPVFVNPLLTCGSCRPCRHGEPNLCAHLGFLGIDADGGAAEVVAAPATQLLPLPPSVGLERAALTEPLSVAVRAVRKGDVRFGHRVHVLGAGPIGLLVATCARLFGAAPVTISEPASGRASAAAELGFELVANPTGDFRPDVVFDCTGHPSASPDVLEWAATGGVVVTVGAYPGVVGVDLQDLMFREITMIGTRAYTPDDVDTAVGLIERGLVDPSRFVTDVLPLRDGPAAIDLLRTGRATKVLLAGPAA